MNNPDNPAHPILVMKFGGTSVGTPEAMRLVVEIVHHERERWPHLVVITSALAGVTDLLLVSAAKAAEGDTQAAFHNANRLYQLHHNMIYSLLSDSTRQTGVQEEIDLLIAEFSSLCQAIGVLGEASQRAMDTVAALGERMSVRLLAAALEEAGMPARAIEATQLIETDQRFQNAHPNLEATTHKTRLLLEPILQQGLVPVVTGFIAATQQGVTTTLGRGGSDYSAGILGAVLPAQEVWIWSDVDGVMSADPRLVPEAHTIQSITYREIAELAYFGAKVLHPKTIRPLVDRGIGLRICNTFNPSHPGTRLVVESNGEKRKKNGNDVIKAVTAIQDLRLITIEGRGMLGVPGVAARTFSTVAATGTSVMLITQASSEQSICFAVPAPASPTVVESLKQAFAGELVNLDIDRIWDSDDVAIITVVGAGMIHTPGVAGQIFSALGAHGVNVIAIAQGSSEVSISLVVDGADTIAAVKTLHALITPPKDE